METSVYGIPEWSHKEMTARKNYRCANCGDIIPRGTRYERSVERRGPRKGKDPLRNVHVHLDCQAKWWVPEGSFRLSNTARVRRATATETLAAPGAVSIHGRVGALVYQLPEELTTRLRAQLDNGLELAVMGELQQSIELMLTVYLQAVGRRKRARQLANILDELAQLAVCR